MALNEFKKFTLKGFKSDTIQLKCNLCQMFVALSNIGFHTLNCAGDPQHNHTWYTAAKQMGGSSFNRITSLRMSTGNERQMVTGSLDSLNAIRANAVTTTLSLDSIPQQPNSQTTQNNQNNQNQNQRSNWASQSSETIIKSPLQQQQQLSSTSQQPQDSKQTNTEAQSTNMNEENSKTNNNSNANNTNTNNNTTIINNTIQSLQHPSPSRLKHMSAPLPLTRVVRIPSVEEYDAYEVKLRNTPPPTPTDSPKGEEKTTQILSNNSNLSLLATPTKEKEMETEVLERTPTKPPIINTNATITTNSEKSNSNEQTTSTTNKDDSELNLAATARQMLHDARLNSPHPTPINHHHHHNPKQHDSNISVARSLLKESDSNVIELENAPFPIHPPSFERFSTIDENIEKISRIKKHEDMRQLLWRSGIPTEYRWKIWPLLAGVNLKKQQQPPNTPSYSDFKSQVTVPDAMSKFEYAHIIEMVSE